MRSVMPGLVPGIHVLRRAKGKTWMAGTSPAMTESLIGGPLGACFRVRRDGPGHVALMQTPDAFRRRAQFQLWIFSYTMSARSSKKRVSILKMRSENKGARYAPAYSTRSPSFLISTDHLASSRSMSAAYSSGVDS